MSRDLLRFITCGSVDDGKSTLIGRLLHDAGSVLDDQMTALRADSWRIGTQGGDLDFALLVDGLAAEREQGITIDVAYRSFATARRRFIVADTPGHEQYTRNMATGASTADLAVVLVDARKGILTQTRRHSLILSLMGVRQVILAVNKMDLIAWDAERFAEIEADYREQARTLELEVTAVPLSALTGVNVVDEDAPPWVNGLTLLQALEAAPTEMNRLMTAPFRLPVQMVLRSGPDFRGYAGQVAAGSIALGDEIVVARSGQGARVTRVLIGDRDAKKAVAGESVNLMLDKEIDCSRGDMIAMVDQAPEVADQFQADLVWMDEAPLLPGRSYWMKIGTRTVAATVSEIRHRLNVDTLEPLAARTLNLNDVALVNLSLDAEVAFDPYDQIPRTGGFILIDRETNATAAAGMIRFALRRSHNIHWQALEVSRERHAAIKGQQARVVWFTGLSGAGKSTIANAVEKRLHAKGRHTYLLDGDNVRHGLCRDLGFTDADRVENVRRVAEVARLMADAGLIVLVSLISPFRAERAAARALNASGEFVEVFVDTPIAEAERRDTKNLYARARAGDLTNFTGIDSPYEPPEAPELHLDTTRLSVEEAADLVVRAALA